MACVRWRHSVIVIAVLYRSQIVEVGVTIVVLNRTLKIAVYCIIPRAVVFLDSYPVIVIANLSDRRHPQFITAFALKLLQRHIQSEIRLLYSLDTAANVFRNQRLNGCGEMASEFRRFPTAHAATGVGAAVIGRIHPFCCFEQFNGDPSCGG